MNKNMGLIDWILLLFLSVLWGGSFFFSKIALSELPPFTVVLVRVAIAAVAMNIIVPATGRRMPLSLKLWSIFLLMGLLNNLIPFSLIFWGQTKITSSLASILNATTPIWTVILAHHFTRDEKLNVNKVFGIIAGFIGVIMMIGFDVLKGVATNVPAQIAVLTAALSYAFAGILGKRSGDIPPVIFATGQITCTTILMIPVVLIFDEPMTLNIPSMQVTGALLGLSILSTALAYIIYFKLLVRAGATNLLLVTFLIPVSASALGVTILSEKLYNHQIAGMLLIFAGLAAIDGRLIKIIRGQK